MKYFRAASFWIIILIGFFMLSRFATNINEEIYEPTWNEFRQDIQDKNIAKLSISENIVSGLYIEKQGVKNKPFQIYVPSVEILYNELERYAPEIPQDYNPPQTTPWWYSLLPTLIMVILLAGIWIFFMNQAQNGGGGKMMTFGKSRARLYVENNMKVTFKDVAGVDEEEEELQEIVEFLRNPRKFAELGARIPKGVLLMGPPGTGKTLLARAVAGEAGVPFFSISGSDFVEMFVGVGASRVRDLFDNAKKNAPCIVFVDEIDAVGRHRGAGLGGGHDEREQTLNQLLVEMDGFDANRGIIIIAATNRPDILDPALLRPGRFDRQIIVDAPDVKGREEILKVHSKNKPLAPDVDLKVLARGTPGFTGADLENLFNEGALLSARRGKKQIGLEELEEAITRVIAGPEKKSRVMSKKEKELTAFHEAGHAVVAEMLPNTDPVHQISIIPRGRAGGYTLVLPEEDKSYMSRTDLYETITWAMGGRAAEELILKEISTGASNDIERATSLANKMVKQYGMSQLGPMAFGDNNGEVFLGKELGHTRNYSDEVAYEIDKEVMGIITKCYQDAIRILTENEEGLRRVADALLEKETLDGKEFLEVFYHKPVEEEKSAEGSVETVSDQAEEEKQEESQKIEQAIEKAGLLHPEDILAKQEGDSFPPKL